MVDSYFSKPQNNCVEFYISPNQFYRFEHNPIN